MAVVVVVVGKTEVDGSANKLGKHIVCQGGLSFSLPTILRKSVKRGRRYIFEVRGEEYIAWLRKYHEKGIFFQWHNTMSKHFLESISDH